MTTTVYTVFNSECTRSKWCVTLAEDGGGAKVIELAKTPGVKVGIFVSHVGNVIQKILPINAANSFTMVLLKIFEIYVNYSYNQDNKRSPRETLLTYR